MIKPNMSYDTSAGEAMLDRCEEARAFCGLRPITLYMTWPVYKRPMSNLRFRLLFISSILTVIAFVAVLVWNLP